jgi:hypothetical protein
LKDDTGSRIIVIAAIGIALRVCMQNDFTSPVKVEQDLQR